MDEAKDLPNWLIWLLGIGGWLIGSIILGAAYNAVNPPSPPGEHDDRDKNASG